MHLNGIAITIVALDESGKPLTAPSSYVWSPGAIRQLEEGGGKALATIGKATSEEVRKALTTVYPKVVIPHG